MFHFEVDKSCQQVHLKQFYRLVHWYDLQGSWRRQIPLKLSINMRRSIVLANTRLGITYVWQYIWNIDRGKSGPRNVFQNPICFLMIGFCSVWEMIFWRRKNNFVSYFQPGHIINPIMGIQMILCFQTTWWVLKPQILDFFFKMWDISPTKHFNGWYSFRNKDIEEVISYDILGWLRESRHRRWLSFFTSTQLIMKQRWVGVGVVRSPTIWSLSVLYNSPDLNKAYTQIALKSGWNIKKNCQLWYM